MSGATNRLTGQATDQQRRQQSGPKVKRRNRKYLTKSSTFFATLLFSLTYLQHVDAEKYVGCLLAEDVCDESETCYDDYAFGRCVSTLEAISEDDLYRFPVFSQEDEASLEAEMTRLYDNGFLWTDDYTQCVLQTVLAAIKDQTQYYDDQLCDILLTEDSQSDNNDPETFQQFEEDSPSLADNAILVTDPILLPSYDKGVANDVAIDVGTEDQELEQQQLPYVDLRDLQEPIELQDLPRFSYNMADNEEDNGQDETFDGDYDDILNDPDQVIFDRRVERMDVKKPGPFFEASPNNFYLDKLAYRYDTETEDDENNSTNAIAQHSDTVTTALADQEDNNNNEEGQQEYEFPMSTSSKAKRVLTLQDLEDNNNGDTQQQQDYVHIALNNKFQKWREGSDFINALAWELGLPEHALSDRTIEKSHVQFKVEPNEQNVDAERIAEALSDDINIQKRLSDSLGVDIAQVAAGKRDDRSSVFPHGQNLNLLILVVVGASATASLLVGGLIFALASRKRRCDAKKVSKLQLSDDIEEKGKLQEEYKQLCRDWSKTSALTEAAKKPMSGPLSKIHAHSSNESNGSNRSSTSSWTDEPANNSMDISTGHMVLAYMEDHLKNKQRLEQEWVGLCGYEAEPSSTTVAFKAENKKKNRYPDKLPYDHNRVILNALVSATNSDYVNASTVTDHDPRNPSYIVTQGPLSQTVADFWQMVWEQGCVVIVMLTRLQDNGYQLCTRYWPEEGSEQYHIFEVHLVSEHVWCEDYLVRSVYLKNTRTGETRTVTQFHFRSWPAHGVPTSTKALLEFRRKVNKSYRGRSCPIVVHCSDGVGRSGTYVLIDMVLNRLSKGCKEIDIAATLEHVRDQRGGMVQNRQQFEFCLMAVAEEVHAILKSLPQQ